MASATSPPETVVVDDIFNDGDGGGGSSDSNHDDDDDDDDDDGSNDGDSLFSVQTCSSAASSIARSNSSLANYRFENNRRYQVFREDNWILPNDEQEQDRMQIVDQMLSLVLGGELHLSPLEKPHRILDLGTGTGVWAIDMAYKYPNARVIGTDLSPIQVAGPANCTFEIEDADDEWIYPPNYFSLVHTRQLLGGITNWPRFFEQSYHTLHPGGWLELQESPHIIYSENASMPPDLPLIRILSLFRETSAALGRACGEEFYGFGLLMEAAGFVDVVETRYRLPIGLWSTTGPTQRQVGRYNILNCLEGVDAFMLAGAARAGVQQARELAESAHANIMDRRLKLYYYFVVLRGRKPLDSER